MGKKEAREAVNYRWDMSVDVLEGTDDVTSFQMERLKLNINKCGLQ